MVSQKQKNNFNNNIGLCRFKTHLPLPIIIKIT